MMELNPDFNHGFGWSHNIMTIKADVPSFKCGFFIVKNKNKNLCLWSFYITFSLETALFPPIYKISGQTGLHCHHVRAWEWQSVWPVLLYMGRQREVSKEKVIKNGWTYWIQTPKRNICTWLFRNAFGNRGDMYYIFFKLKKKCP